MLGKPQPRAARAGDFAKQCVREHIYDVFVFLICIGVAYGIYRSPITTYRTFPIFFDKSGDIVYPTLAHPYRGWILAPWLVGVVCVGGPVIIYMLSQFVIRSGWDAVNATLGTCWAAALSSLVQAILKQTVGGFRPYFLDVCQPSIPSAILNNTGLERSGYNGIMYTIDICTQKDLRKLKDAVTSFPSGHAAVAMAGVGFLFLWANGKLKPLSERKGHLCSIALLLNLVIGGALAACSVAVDGSHHWYDVLGGSVIGAVMAIVSYRCMYAAVWDWRSNHLPLRRTAED